MSVVNTGDTFRFFGSDMKTFANLPAAVYTVSFNMDNGFFLTSHLPFTVTEKVYGGYDEKVRKIMRTYSAFDRSLGVILTGHKGSGKSLCAKMLAINCVKNGIPVIVCNQYIKGLVGFIESIPDNCMVLFDEFDKAFPCDDDDSDNPQNSMLPLFDGTSCGKKLFVVTCNKINGLSNYMINRPGRFHYNLEFGCPGCNEIEEYLKDNLKPEYYDKIRDVIALSYKVDLSYDCLRAIAIELNFGETLNEAMQDLNITNDENVYFDVCVRFKDGTEVSDTFKSIETRPDYSAKVRMYNKHDDLVFWFIYNSNDIKIDDKHGMYLNGEDLKTSDDVAAAENPSKNKREVSRVYFTRSYTTNKLVV